MSSQNVNGKADLADLIQTAWSKKFYEAFKNQTKLVSLFSRDYEGEIKNMGDTVKVNQITVAAAETLTDDKQKFKAGKITVVPKSLTVNRRTVHAVEITDLAQLQSIPFMESLKAEMTYQINLKMEQEVIAELIAGLTTYAIATSGIYVKNDLVNARTKAATLLWGKMPDKYSAIGCGYYGDLLKDSVLTSQDYVEGKALMDQNIPNVFGMKPFEHDLLSNDQAIHFHKSALQMAVQKGMNFKISDLHAQNKFGFLVSCDIVWDMELFDAARGFIQENAGSAIGV